MTKNNRTGYQQYQLGFSFIEIMVVLVIIGILAAAVGGNFLGKADEARIKQVNADFSTIEGQLKLYKLDNFRYPTTEQGLQALVEKPTIDPIPRQWQKGGYLEALPVDPWGNYYLYSAPGETRSYDLYSYGADGVAGGIDADKDIYSWERFEKK
ncbi:type II secretion system protein GspG [Candidatus Endobugula sertula]|uniref:Type II secretion system core protein G n=1 Tax=Candidatus Endobugula sertula TaxID=62101 RepID=A0A1D2QSM5_9GAMM|nr:type II secretion system protein GspG [Candidatus Endobugula sertula]